MSTISRLRPLFRVSTLSVALLVGAQAHADEALFGYLYTTDSLPKGKWEYEQSQTARWGKARGTYFGLDLRNEIEYGVTDRFSASLYLNSNFTYTRNVYNPENVSTDLPNQNNYDIDGVSTEFKFRVLSPYTDPIGLTLYAEPELDVRDSMTGMMMTEKELEMRLILQKNFLDDQLVTAMNIMFDPEWDWDSMGMTSDELWLEVTLGASYRFAPKWSAGIEFRNHREYPGMNFNNQEHSAFFLGPNVHYAARTWWATLTFLPQICGSPQVLGTGSDGKVISDSFRYLAQHEMFELRLKVGIEL